MKIIEQSHKIIKIDENPLELIEQAARTCWRSEDKIKPGSDAQIAKTLKAKGHGAMLEFGDATVEFITNRGVTHELVRHRVGMSYAQESTRYVKYGDDMEFILPVWMDKKHLGLWDTKRVFNMSIGVSDSDCVTFMTILGSCQRSYKNLINRAGWKPEQAREVLPNALRTKITVKGNFRAWLHMFDLRCSKKAHPQIRALMLPTLAEFHRRVPVIFEDIYSKYEEEIK